MRKPNTSSQSNKERVPQRTCVACRQVRPKRDLVRLVRNSSGGVEIDLSGRKSGRGAYLCRTPLCWEAGLNRGRLDHELETKLTAEAREEVLRLGKTLCEGETIDDNRRTGDGQETRA